MKIIDALRLVCDAAEAHVSEMSYPANPMDLDRAAIATIRAQFGLVPEATTVSRPIAPEIVMRSPAFEAADLKGLPALRAHLGEAQPAFVEDGPEPKPEELTSMYNLIMERRVTEGLPALSDGRPAGWTEALALGFIAECGALHDAREDFATAFNEGDWAGIQRNWPEFQEWVNKHHFEGQLSTCDECGAEVTEIVGCPDGAEICRTCFDAGGH